MACLSCGKWHLPLEGCHEGDTAAGVALRDKLVRARAAQARFEVGRGAMDFLGPVESPVVERSAIVGNSIPDRPVKKKKGERGRPRSGLPPWKERNAERLKAYKREYMRRYRARLRTSP